MHPKLPWFVTDATRLRAGCDIDDRCDAHFALSQSATSHPLFGSTTGSMHPSDLWEKTRSTEKWLRRPNDRNLPGFPVSDQFRAKDFAGRSAFQSPKVLLRPHRSSPVGMEGNLTLKSNSVVPLLDVIVLVALAWYAPPTRFKATRMN